MTKSRGGLILWITFIITIAVILLAYMSIDNFANGSSEINFIGLTIKTGTIKVGLVFLGISFAFYIIRDSIRLEHKKLDIAASDTNSHKIFVTVHDQSSETSFIEGATVKLLLKPEPLIKETDKNGSAIFFYNRNTENVKSILNAEKEGYEKAQAQSIVIKNEEQFLVPLKSLNTNKIVDHNQRTEITTKSSVEQLIEVLEESARNEDNLSIIRYGLGLSRTLWIEGEYDLRLRLGFLLEDAASKLNDIETQAAVLIDDLGWTLVTLKKYSEAEQKIKHGKLLAENSKNYYLFCKALRHLGGINIQRRQFEEAILNLNDTLAFSDKIQDLKLKEEMVAGTNYGLGWAYSENKNYDQAEKYCLIAKKMFEEIGDHERAVKTYSQLGAIYENKDISIAKDYYRKGLLLATKIKRKDEIINNNLGLARVFKSEGDNCKANEHLESASRLQKEV
jgi:tetratricopeptide (TPR) repeat protein